MAIFGLCFMLYSRVICFVLLICFQFGVCELGCGALVIMFDCCLFWFVGGCFVGLWDCVLGVGFVFD